MNKLMEIRPLYNQHSLLELVVPDIEFVDMGLGGEMEDEVVDAACNFIHNPDVIFELFNEPHYVSWQCWLQGGCWAQADEAGSGEPWSAHPYYYAVGMQTLYDAVRSTGATNLVMVAGLDWAYDMSGFLEGKRLPGLVPLER